MAGDICRELEPGLSVEVGDEELAQARTAVRVGRRLKERNLHVDCCSQDDDEREAGGPETVPMLIHDQAPSREAKAIRPSDDSREDGGRVYLPRTSILVRERR
jgi:hypothetical protein